MPAVVLNAAERSERKVSAAGAPAPLRPSRTAITRVIMVPRHVDGHGRAPARSFRAAHAPATPATMATTEVLPDLRLPRWLMPSLAATTSVVLASHAFLVVSLAHAGVTWRDGDAAYGVDAGDISGLPPGLAHAVAAALLLAALFGLPPVLPATGVAALSVGRSAETRTAPLASAVVVLIAAAALLALQVTWGDELWVWMLD